ncbi:MAG TPA: hypothetical protein VFQ28_03420 [Gaiella sp.]|nr:hypothetical protein [Gaiella sp.]
MRERAPWYRRRLGPLAGVAAALVAVAAVVGFAGPGTGAWRVVQVALVTLAAAVYLVALVRSPD